MMQIAIVDDQISDASLLQKHFEQYIKETGENIRITLFSDGDQLVQRFNSQFDMIFMDVEMKFMDGMSAAEEIRKLDSKVIIIFVTNMHQYAIKGYQVEAFDYLVKPVNYFAFFQCIDRAITRMKKRMSKHIVINIKGGTMRLDVMDIYYVESSGHNVIYHTASGEYESAGALKNVEEAMQSIHFFRVNKWCILNLAHVDGFQGGNAKLMGMSFPVARAREKGFLEALTSYWGEVYR